MNFRNCVMIFQRISDGSFKQLYFSVLWVYSSSKQEFYLISIFWEGIYLSVFSLIIGKRRTTTTQSKCNSGHAMNSAVFSSKKVPLKIVAKPILPDQINGLWTKLWWYGYYDCWSQWRIWIQWMKDEYNCRHLYRYFLLYICYVKNHESSSEIHCNQSPIPGYKLLMPIQIIYVTIRIQIRICMYLLQWWQEIESVFYWVTLGIRFGYFRMDSKHLLYFPFTTKSSFMPSHSISQITVFENHPKCLILVTNSNVDFYNR